MRSAPTARHAADPCPRCSPDSTPDALPSGDSGFSSPQLQSQQQTDPQHPQSALSRIPVDQQDQPIYEQTDPDTAWDAILEQTEGDADMAQSVISDKESDKESELTHAQSAKPRKGTTVSDKIAAQKERKAAIDRAQSDLDHWKQIAATQQRRQEAEAARKEAGEAAEGEGSDQQGEGEALPAEQPPATDAEQTSDPDAAPDAAPDALPSGDSGFSSPQLQSEQQSQQQTAPQPPQSALSRIPVDQQGQPIYEQTDPDTAWDAILEQTEGDADMAQSVISDIISDKESELARAQSAKPRKGTTVADKIAAQKERKAAIDRAQSDLDHWKQIAATQQRRQEAAAARPVSEYAPEELDAFIDGIFREHQFIGNDLQEDDIALDIIDWADNHPKATADEVKAAAQQMIDEWNEIEKERHDRQAAEDEAKRKEEEAKREEEEEKRKEDEEKKRSRTRLDQVLFLFKDTSDTEAADAALSQYLESLSPEHLMDVAKRCLGSIIHTKAKDEEEWRTIAREHTVSHLNRLGITIKKGRSGLKEGDRIATIKGVSAGQVQSIDPENKTVTVLSRNEQDGAANTEVVPLSKVKGYIQAARQVEEDNMENVDDTEDNGVGEWYNNLHLSGELDQNDSPFVLTPDGETDFGNITSAHHLPAAPIRLALGNKDNGYIHINRRHGKQIKSMGFNSIGDFVKYIASNFTRIKEGDAYENERGGLNQTYLLQLQDGHNNTLFVQLSRDGKYWNVNSAGIFGKNYGNKKKEIWSASEVQNGNSVIASDGLQAEPITDNGSASNGNPSKSSEGKDTNNSLSEQASRTENRTETAENRTETAENRTEAEEAAARKAAYTIEPSTYTNKKGKTSDVSLLKFKGELTPEQERAVKEFAKERMGEGRFAPARGWKDRESGGWMFRNEEDARKAAEMVGNEESVADAQPMTAKELRDAVDPKQETAQQPPKPANRQDKAPSTGKTEDKPKNSGQFGLVSDERMEELKARLRKKLGSQLNMGIDPEILAIGIELAAGHIDRGIRTFSDYAKVMVEDLGDVMRPYLKAFYNGARDMPEITECGLDAEMTPYEDVRTFDTANFDKPQPDPLTRASMMAEEGKAQAQADKANQTLKEKRNERRKKADEQRAADTAAVAEEAETIASEAETHAEDTSDEQSASAAAERVDEALGKVSDQLALLGYYEADKKEKDYDETYGYMRNAEKKAVKDAANLASRLIDDLGLDRDEATLGSADKKGRRKKKPLATADIAPTGGDITITLPLSEGRELYISVMLNPAERKGDTSGTRDNLQADSITYRVNNPSGSRDRYEHNIWVDAKVPYAELVKGIQRIAYKYLPSNSEAKDGVYHSGDEVQFSSNGGRTWQDAKVIDPDDNGYVLLDTGLAPVMYVSATHDQLRHKAAEEKTDSQGNPLNADGSLKVDKVDSVNELTDEDFSNPVRNVELPMLPKNVAKAIGTNGKPVVIKKNIFARNAERHPDISARQSRDILTAALYTPDLYGQNQKSKRPYNWIVINTKDSEGKNRLVLLEVNPNKDNIEIVHWHYARNNSLKQIKRQAESEGGLILILPSEKSEEAGGLSSRTPDLSSVGKGTKSAANPQESKPRKKAKEDAAKSAADSEDFIDSLIDKDAVMSLPEDDAITLQVVDILNPGLTDHSDKSKIDNFTYLLPKISDGKLAELDEEYGDDKIMGRHIKAEVNRRKEAEIESTDLPKPAKDKAKRALHGSDSMTDNAALAEAERRIEKKKTPKEADPQQPVADLLAGKAEEKPETELKSDKNSEIHRTFAIAVKNDMLASLDNGTKPYRSILDLRKRAKALGMDVDDEGRTDILLQELVEDGLVRAAREVTSRTDIGSKEAYDLICKLYEMQPTISARSSNRIKMQQYSTPLPMAWCADHFAMHGKEGGLVLEPTAGNGMLVFGVPAGQVHANELDETRLANLREQGFAEVTQQDASEPFEGGQKYDVIISNPSFGKREAAEYDGKMIGGLDPQITLNALASMKDDGRAAIIIGGNMEYAANGGIKNMKAFFTYLYDHYNVKGVVDMDGKLYAKQGTTFPTRMILIDGRRSEEERAQSTVYPPVKSKAVRKAESFEDLHNIIDEITNSKEKTNGTEILRSQQGRPLPVAGRPSGRTDGGRHREQHPQDDGDGLGRRRGGKHDVDAAPKDSTRVLRGEQRENPGDGEALGIDAQG